MRNLINVSFAEKKKVLNGIKMLLTNNEKSDREGFTMNNIALVIMDGVGIGPLNCPWLLSRRSFLILTGERGPR